MLYLIRDINSFVLLFLASINGKLYMRSGYWYEHVLCIPYVSLLFIIVM